MLARVAPHRGDVLHGTNHRRANDEVNCGQGAELPRLPQAGEDFRVHTEFGADAWTWCLRAGFDAVTITAIEYPTALALTAWRGAPMPLTAKIESRRLRGELDTLCNSRLWRVTSVLRRLTSSLR